MNKYDLLWAQLGVLNYKRYEYILKEYGDLESAYYKVGREFLMKMGMRKKTIDDFFVRKEFLDYEYLLDSLNRLDGRVISFANKEYPPRLREIVDYPPFLFVRGDISNLDRSISIVGTRDITAYGQMMTRYFTSELVSYGLAIVSGLAIGIDSAAHQVCLENKGRTIAVLGTGIDNIYPKQNYDLAMDIIKTGGAIISEFPLGEGYKRYNFPQRNKIISGLSLGTLIVEGGRKSGALITANFALEQGRELFAVPNNITKVSLSGTNYLIKKGEAKLVEHAFDILEELDIS